jgi:hypothetical protein
MWSKVGLECYSGVQTGDGKRADILINGIIPTIFEFKVSNEERCSGNTISDKIKKKLYKAVFQVLEKKCYDIRHIYNHFIVMAVVMTCDMVYVGQILCTKIIHHGEDGVRTCLVLRGPLMTASSQLLFPLSLGKHGISLVSLNRKYECIDVSEMKLVECWRMARLLAAFYPLPSDSLFNSNLCSEAIKRVWGEYENWISIEYRTFDDIIKRLGTINRDFVKEYAKSNEVKKSRMKVDTIITDFANFYGKNLIRVKNKRLVGFLLCMVVVGCCDRNSGSPCDFLRFSFHDYDLNLIEKTKEILKDETRTVNYISRCKSSTAESRLCQSQHPIIGINTFLCSYPPPVPFFSFAKVPARYGKGKCLDPPGMWKLCDEFLKERGKECRKCEVDEWNKKHIKNMEYLVERIEAYYVTSICKYDSEPVH